MEQKVQCNKCLEVKYQTEFSVRKDSSTGYRRYCWSCELKGKKVASDKLLEKRILDRSKGSIIPTTKTCTTCKVTK